MATALTKTQLPLDTFAYHAQINPLHFNQVQLNNVLVSKLCGLPILQYDWQLAQRIGREAIAQAVADAESKIEHELGFKLTAQWIAGEQHSISYNQHPLIRADWKHVRYGGIEAWSLIDATVAVTYSDEDSDNYFETATMTVTTTVTDPEEIAVFYPGVDVDDIDEEGWEVRPIKVKITAGVATITCRREQLVKKSLLTEMFDPRAVEGDTAGNFLTEVSVFRHYNDPSQQFQFISDGTCCTSCQACGYSIQTGCLSVRDARTGMLLATAGDWNAETSTFTLACNCFGYPFKGKLYYRAGLGFKDYKLRMPPHWERAVTYYALTLLDRPLCECNSLAAFADVWRTDLALRSSSGAQSQSFSIGNRVVNCPLGTTRGALHAWDLIQKERVGEAAN